MKIVILIMCLTLFAITGVFFNKPVLEKFVNWVIFSKTSIPIFSGLGGTWFLINVLNLSNADFGKYRILLFMIFSLLILISVFKMREFISVRWMAIYMLLASHLMLKNIYCEMFIAKTILVSVIYIVILFATALGLAPYLFKTMFDSILHSKTVRISAASVFLCIGILFSYVAINS